jgi:hypothetical protein
MSQYSISKGTDVEKNEIQALMPDTLVGNCYCFRDDKGSVRIANLRPVYLRLCSSG